MKNYFFASAICTMLLAPNLNACTGVKVTARDGSTVHGRTLEFGTPVEVSVAVVPRGYAFKSTTPQGPGLSYTSKYAAIGAITFGSPVIMDGLNEKGLSVGIFYFPGFAGYTPVTKENQSKALAPAEFANWIVSQFATVDEVKQALSNVVIVPTVTPSWGSTPPPFHYIVYDITGQSLVIEPIDGKLVTYDNPLGTFTNSPTFDWHLNNLRNFINLSPYNANPVTVSGVVFSQFGQGSGMVGIPGDFTPPSRFVRAALYSSAATPAKDADEAIFSLFHILNQFDIPPGVSRSKPGSTESDMTQFTCARDPQSLQYYFKSYDDQNIKVLDLKQCDPNAKEVKSLATTGKTKVKDISMKLQ